jgi:hypothetical protein
MSTRCGWTPGECPLGVELATDVIGANGQQRPHSEVAESGRSMALSTPLRTLPPTGTEKPMVC